MNKAHLRQVPFSKGIPMQTNMALLALMHDWNSTGTGKRSHPRSSDLDSFGLDPDDGEFPDLDTCLNSGTALQRVRDTVERRLCIVLPS